MEFFNRLFRSNPEKGSAYIAGRDQGLDNSHEEMSKVDPEAKIKMIKKKLEEAQNDFNGVDGELVRSLQAQIENEESMLAKGQKLKDNV